MNFKKWIGTGLAVVMSLSTLQLSYAADETDVVNGIENHWSKGSFERWMNYEIVQGNEDGHLMPDKEMTKAEYITVLNRFMGLENQSEASLSDVRTGVWYEADVRKALAAGYLSGSKKGSKLLVDPEKPLTRKEAVQLFTAALDLESTIGGTSKFTDTKKLTAQEQEAISIMNKLGAVNGYPDGTFRPDAIVTRGELVSLLDKGVKAYYNEPGSYNKTVKGLVIINSENVTLKGAKILGDVIITEKSLKNLKIEDTKVFGSVYVENQEKAKEIKVSGESLINKIYAEGNVTFDMDKESKIAKLTIRKDESNIKIEGKGVVTEVAVKGNKVVVNDEKVKEDQTFAYKNSKFTWKNKNGVDVVSSASQSSSGGGGGTTPTYYYNIIDTRKTDIKEIQHVLYYVIVLDKGTKSDYTFYLNGQVIEPTLVNTEATILKYELKDYGTYTLKVVGSSNQEEITRTKGL